MQRPPSHQGAGLARARHRPSRGRWRTPRRKGEIADASGRSARCRSPSRAPRCEPGSPSRAPPCEPGAPRSSCRVELLPVGVEPPHLGRAVLGDAQLHPLLDVPHRSALPVHISHERELSVIIRLLRVTTEAHASLLLFKLSASSQRPLSYRSWNVQVEQGSWSGDLAVVRT